MTDHVLRDRAVREHISRHETSAAEAKAGSRTDHEHGTRQGAVKRHTFPAEAERLRVRRARRVRLRATCRTHAPSAVCAPQEHPPHSLYRAPPAPSCAARRSSPSFAIPCPSSRTQHIHSLASRPTSIRSAPASSAFCTSSDTICTSDVRICVERNLLCVASGRRAMCGGVSPGGGIAAHPPARCRVRRRGSGWKARKRDTRRQRVVENDGRSKFGLRAHQRNIDGLGVWQRPSGQTREHEANTRLVVSSRSA